MAKFPIRVLGISGRLSQPLALVIGEEKSLVLLDRPTQRGSELASAILIVLRGLQERARIGGLVAEITVQRTMQVIGARLGNHVDDSAQGAPVLRSEAVVDDAKFTDRFLRRSSPLRACAFVDVVGAIHSDGIAQVAHAAKGDASNIRLREGGLNAGSAGRDAGREQCEIHELPAVYRQRLNLAASRSPG